MHLCDIWIAFETCIPIGIVIYKLYLCHRLGALLQYYASIVKDIPRHVLNIEITVQQMYYHRQFRYKLNYRSYKSFV